MYVRVQAHGSLTRRKERHPQHGACDASHDARPACQGRGLACYKGICQQHVLVQITGAAAGREVGTNGEYGPSHVRLVATSLLDKRFDVVQVAVAAAVALPVVEDEGLGRAGRTGEGEGVPLQVRSQPTRGVADCRRHAP